jgi:Subtilase family
MPTRFVDNASRTLKEAEMPPKVPLNQRNLRREIEKHIDCLARFPEDQQYQREILTRLANGRRARGLPPFAELPNGRVPALALREFLVRTADLERRDVQKMIKVFRLSQESVPGLDLKRLTPRGKFRAVKFRVAAFLLRRIKKVPVTPNYLVPLSGWSKAKGGPEPTADLPQPGTASSTPFQVAVIDTGRGERTDGWLKGLTNPAVDPLYPNPATTTLGLAGGHGTFVAGIVQRVEPRTDIRMYLGLDVDGVGTDDEVGSKIKQAALDGADIINLSLGTQTPGDVPPLGMKSGIEAARTHNQGILIVCAAGNYGDTRKVWPAAFSLQFPEVVAVAGLNAQVGVPSPEWTTHGDFVNISTVAEGIASTYVKGTEDTKVDPSPNTYALNAFAVWSGTSFAAPQVTAKVAKICLDDNVAPTQAIETLKASGTLIPGYGRAVKILSGI